MFDIDLLRGYYTGNRIKIALIDTGIYTREYDNINIMHYIVDNGVCHLLKEFPNSVDIHGAMCGETILNIAKDVTLIDVNVLNKNGEITEENVYEAIMFAITMKVDIINISIGFSLYSSVIGEACKKAYEDSILIVASGSNDNDICFPADDMHVIKVIKDINDIPKKNYAEENIKRSNIAEYQVQCPDYSGQIKRSNKGIKLVTASGNSVACAFFSGILALFLESRPLVSRYELRNLIFGLSKLKNDISDDDKDIEKTVELNSLYCVLSSYYNIYNGRYSSILCNNIKGYYDLRHNNIKLLNGKELSVKTAIEEKGYDNITVFNPLKYERIKVENLPFKNINYIGNFDFETLRGHTIEPGTMIRDIRTPIILIAGIGMECGKFITQLELMKQMKDAGLLNYCITYNMLGYLFNMDVLKYPEKIVFPDYFFSINNMIRDIEDKNDEEYEAFIINVGGGMGPLSQANVNKFGSLYYSYITALPVDFIVICTNTLIDVDYLKNEIGKLRLIGIKNIAIVVSNLTYDRSVFSNADNMIVYEESYDMVESYVEECRKRLRSTSVYRQIDVEKGNLYREILKKMS